jgi:hypothetical protein
LIRYKKEVGIYELKMIENNRIEDKERAKKMKKVKDSTESQQSSTKTGVSNNNDDGTRTAAVSLSFPIQNVQIPTSMANGGTMTQGPPQVYAPSIHTLTSNELDMARLLLEMELRAIEEAQSLRQQRSQFELHGLNNHGFGTTPESAAAAAAILRANGVYGGGEGEFGANIAAAELQVQQRRNISNILDTGGDHMMAAKEAEMIRRMALGLDSTGGDSMTTASNEVEMRKRLADLGGDLSTIANEAELKYRLGFAGLVGQDHIIASKEDEIRKHIIREAEIRARFGMNENRGDIIESSIDADIRQRLGIGGDPMTAFAEADIRKRLGLSISMTDYQMATSAEAEIRKHLGLNGQISDSATAHHEAEMRRRLGLEIEPSVDSNHEAEISRNRLPMGAMGDQITSTVPMNGAEFQKRLAAIQNQDLNASDDASSIGRISKVASRGVGLGMGETYEENLLREEKIRQQEILLARFGGSAASSLYGGNSGPRMPMLGGLGRGVPAYGAVGARGSFASAVDTRMASIRAAAGMSVPMERLTEEELRALSSGRGL